MNQLNGQRYPVAVNYIGDLDFQPPANAMLVECDEDYVRVCRELSPEGLSTANLGVWVRSKIHFVWLRDFLAQIGCSAVFQEKTARIVLAERWNVQIPDWLKDTDVINQNMLNLKVEPQPHRVDFPDRILVHLLGVAFQPDILSAANLADVIKALVSDEAKSVFRQYPILKRALEAKCETWVQSGHEIWIKKTCSYLCENPDLLWRWLSLWAGLHSYPERLLGYVLSPELILFIRNVPVAAVQDLPLESEAREQIQTQVDRFFGDIQNQITSSEEFGKVVDWTSGRLAQEYHFIVKILRSRQIAVTPTDIQKVQNKFRHCPGVTVSNLKTLHYNIEPCRPRLIGPTEEWSSAEWIRWTRDEYTPYRSWQIHNKQHDAQLEKTVIRFSEWLFKEYTTIHSDPNLSLIHCLGVLASGELEDSLSIILIVDCLPLEFVSLLDDAFGNAGFCRHDVQYRFAALPSTTEFNKPGLLSGEWQFGSVNYEVVLKTRACADDKNREVVYLSNLKALSEVSAPKNRAIVVLNFLDGDEVLHSDVESKNSTYDEELHRLFTRMAESVNRLCMEWVGPKESVSIYVVTDHGACYILDEEKNSFDSKIVNKLFSDEKHRFAAIAEERAGDIPDNLWALGRRFKQPFGSDTTLYFLPKGHNTVRHSGRSRGYMHGGATPEEIIVPTALYKLVQTESKKPAARFLNLMLESDTGRAKFYIQRVMTLVIEVQNPNPSELHIIRASVLSPETDVKDCEYAIIPAGSAKTIHLSCYFKKSALGKNILELELAYTLSGEEYSFTLKLDCEFKSAMAHGFNLRDL